MGTYTLPSIGAGYSSTVGTVFLFNIMVGTGALALPMIFYKAGLVLGTLFMAVVALLGYITATFTIESMAYCNALLRLRERKGGTGTHEDPLIDRHHNGDPNTIYDISQLTEFGIMMDMLYPQWGKTAWFVIIIVYLYGDLAIYAVFLPLTLAEIFPTLNVGSLNLVDKRSVVNVYIATMAACTIPLIYFDIQKTKYLQALTFVTRNLTFWIMLGICLHRVATGLGGQMGQPFPTSPTQPSPTHPPPNHTPRHCFWLIESMAFILQLQPKNDKP